MAHTTLSIEEDAKVKVIKYKEEIRASSQSEAIIDAVTKARRVNDENFLDFLINSTPEQISRLQKTLDKVRKVKR